MRASAAAAGPFQAPPMRERCKCSVFTSRQIASIREMLRHLAKFVPGSSPLPCGFCSGGRHQGDWALKRGARARSVRILRSGGRRSFAGQSPLPLCGAPSVFSHLPKVAPVAATVRLGHLMFQTKRWNEATRMADQKGQWPSLAITMRVLFGRTTSRRLRFEARRNERAPFGF